MSFRFILQRERQQILKVQVAVRRNEFVPFAKNLRLMKADDYTKNYIDNSCNRQKVLLAKRVR